MQTSTQPMSATTGTKCIQQGPTPLIAAMRCLVASMLGQDTITLITSE